MIEASPAKVQLVKQIPTGRGWLYEPKLDGYRGLVSRESAHRMSVLSRNGKDLARYFPELVRLAEELPGGTILDGEIVQPSVDGVSFFALQRRLMLPLAERPKLASQSPVAFVAFDILLDHAEDVRRSRLTVRRNHLRRVLDKMKDPLLQLVSQTADSKQAAAWLDELRS